MKVSINLIRDIVTKKVSYYMNISLGFSGSRAEDKDLGVVIYPYFGGDLMKE